MSKVRGRSLLFGALVISILTVRQLSAVPATTPVTVVGEVVETYCWVVHEVGGPAHAQCGIDCAKRGLPVALYESMSRTAYILLPARDKMGLPPELVAAMGQRVRVEGQMITRGGIKFLVVQSWQRPPAKR